MATAHRGGDPLDLSIPPCLYWLLLHATPGGVLPAVIGVTQFIVVPSSSSIGVKKKQKQN